MLGFFVVAILNRIKLIVVAKLLLTKIKCKKNLKINLLKMSKKFMYDQFLSINSKRDFLRFK